MKFNLSLFKKTKNVTQTETEQSSAASPTDPVEHAIRETIEKAFQGHPDACRDIFDDYLKNGETDPSYKSVLDKYYDQGKQNNLKAISFKTLADQEHPDAINRLAAILEDTGNILYTPVKALVKATNKDVRLDELARVYRAKLPQLNGRNGHSNGHPHNGPHIERMQHVNGNSPSAAVPLSEAHETKRLGDNANDAIPDAHESVKKTAEITVSVAEESVAQVETEEPSVAASVNSPRIEEEKIPDENHSNDAPSVDKTDDNIADKNETPDTEEALSESLDQKPEESFTPEIEPEVTKKDKLETDLKEANTSLISSPSASIWGEKAVPAFDPSASFAKKEDVENKDRLFYNTSKSIDLTSTQTVYDIFYAQNADGTSKSLKDMPDLEVWKNAMIGYGKFKDKDDFERNITWMHGIVVLDLAEAPDLDHADAKAELMNAFAQLQQSKFYLLDPETQSILNAYAERHSEPTNSKKARGLLTLASHGHPQASFAMFKNIRDKNPEILNILQKAGFESKDGYKDLAHRFLYSAALEKDIDAMRMVNSSIVRPTTSGQDKMVEMLHSLGLYNQKNVTRYFQKYIAEHNGENETISGPFINFTHINKARNILAEQLKILYPNLDAPSPAQRLLLKKQEEELQLRAQKIENRMTAIDNLDNLDERKQNSLFQFSMKEDGSEDEANDPWSQAFANKEWTAEEISTLKAKTLIQTAIQVDDANSAKANAFCLEALFDKGNLKYKRLNELLEKQPSNISEYPEGTSFTWSDFFLIKNAKYDKRAHDAIAHDLEHEKKNGQTGLLQLLRIQDANLEEDALETEITFEEMLKKRDWAARRMFDIMAKPVMESKEEELKDNDKSVALGDHYFHLLSEKGPTAFLTLVKNDYVGRQITLAVDHMRDKDLYPEDLAILNLFADNYSSLIGAAVVQQAIFEANPTACMLAVDTVDYPKETPYAEEIEEAIDILGVRNKQKLNDMMIYTAALSGEPHACKIMLGSIENFPEGGRDLDRVKLMRETKFLRENFTLNGNAESVKIEAKKTFILKFFYDSQKAFFSPKKFEPVPYPPTVEQRLEEMREKAKRIMIEKMTLEAT